LKNLEPKIIAESLRLFTNSWEADNYPPPNLSEVVVAQRDRVKTLQEMAEKSRYFYEAPKGNIILDTMLLPVISFLQTHFNQVYLWEKTEIYSILIEATKHYALKPNILFRTLRHILLGEDISPPMDVTLQLLGKSRVLARLQQALNTVKQN
jgi:glutamyl-tRNA synthetase